MGYMKTNKNLRELREYKKADHHAPKFRKDVHRILNNDVCNRIIEENKEALIAHKPSDIRRIVKGFHEYAANWVLHNRGPLELPYKLGHCFIGVFGKWYNGTDRTLSAEIGLEAHHRNNHSDGYGAGFYYSTSLVRSRSVMSDNMWGFLPMDKVRRRIKNSMETMWKEFIYMKNSKHVERALRDATKIQANDRIYGEEKKDYNPLSFD